MHRKGNALRKKGIFNPGAINTSQKQNTKETKQNARRQESNEQNAMACTPGIRGERNFPTAVNCGGIGRRACLFPISPFVNYRAEVKCRSASIRVSPNEPSPMFFFFFRKPSPSTHPSLLSPRLPRCLILTAPASVSYECQPKPKLRRSLQPLFNQSAAMNKHLCPFNLSEDNVWS